MNAIGEYIRNARKEKGFSLNDIERLTGIGKARLSRYENDWVLPTIDTVETIALAIGVAPKRLVGWK